ncbi:MAG: squalene synthase HpnD [Oxalobacter sp.]|nr:MAG: squalene synthase HpnD [Oxalobacter sp.]
MSPDAYCQKRTAQSGSSFYYSFLFLPSERRRAITALYAFCREVDDVVDECTDPGIARIQLQWWRNEIDQMLQGAPNHPVTRALQPHLTIYGLEGAHLHALIDGMAMDLNTVRYPDYESLRNYCWHVASVVGILSARIFGITQLETLQYAEQLGLAFQLTNIIRDVGQDAQMGRIYLPRDELARFGVIEEDLRNAHYTPQFLELMRFQAERAETAYDSAFALLPIADRRPQKPGLIMAAIYRRLLEEIRRNDFCVLDRRISLSTPRKIWLAWKAYVNN